ncbi:MAG: hypothetical protein QXI37_04490 [Thermoprotei archaeon]
MTSRLTYLALAVAVIIASLLVAGYTVNSTIISPGTKGVGLPPQGNLTIPSQASYELYFTAGNHFTVKSSIPIDVYAYVSNPSSYNGEFDQDHLNVTSLSLTITATGDIYLILTNPNNSNATVTYTFS